ncbi:MAG: DUF3392 domain-containing protein [Verrucomicrobiae bacterium]|nr:DUF3392 domain-containing protein [Verrucomicrobiae bacterium]NNJ42958.1 DUF3392 family protein [Akkermansiaceae bacterium]
MQEIINNTAGYLRGHGDIICYAWTAAWLVLYGSVLAKFAKNVARSWHFVFRVLFFIVVCGFAYGMLTVLIASQIHQKLSRLNDSWYIVAVVSAFFLIGILAEKKRQI